MKTTRNTYLTKLTLGKGHWKITAFSTENSEEKVITTNDSMLIDDAFNSEDGDLSYYDSVDEARQVLIDKIFDQ